MKLGSYIKYSVRFVFLQTVLTLLTINYLNTYLISKDFCEQCVGNNFLIQINNNLWEDRNRFFSIIPEKYVDIEIFVAIFIFVFLIILYSTKFYTYVNELSFSIDRNYL
jgi:ABC-type multidrug transport system permease subunit